MASSGSQVPSFLPVPLALLPSILSPHLILRTPSLGCIPDEWKSQDPDHDESAPLAETLQRLKLRHASTASLPESHSSSRLCSILSIISVSLATASHLRRVASNLSCEEQHRGPEVRISAPPYPHSVSTASLVQ
jgi:hypothetical protein